jgi:hypothetical protein
MCEVCDTIVTELSYLEHENATEMAKALQENNIKDAAFINERLQAYTKVRRMIAHEQSARATSTPS